jgi:predicted dienelactone hydrolase
MVLLVLFACGADDDTDSTDAGPLDAFGSYAVGTDEDVFTSSERVNLTVQTWFPSDPSSLDGTEEAYSYESLWSDQALEGLDADCSAVRPVVVFSHGNAAMRFQSTFLTEWLASHGYVVVAPDHAGNTIFDMDEDRIGELAFRRPLDVAASFDWLVDVAAAAGGPLEGCVDESAGYAVVGHSFGGYTSLAVSGAVVDLGASAEWCKTHDEWLCTEIADYGIEIYGEGAVIDGSDSRVWASIPMAPAGYEVLLGGLPDIAVPIAVLGAADDALTTMADQVDPIYRDLTAQTRALGTLDRSGHFIFSDACAILPAVEFCGDDDDLTPEEAHPVISTTVLAWLEQARGSTTAGAYLPPAADFMVWEEGAR